MKLLTYQKDGHEKVGVLVDENRVVDLAEAANLQSSKQTAAFSTIVALIEGGDAALEEARNVVAKASEETLVDLGSVKILAPIPLPPQVRDFLAFEKHLQQAIYASIKLRAKAEGADPDEYLKGAQAMGADKIPDMWYERPIYYKANRFALTGQDETVQWPAYSTLMDYECELACVIGKAGRDIPEAKASEHIFGFMIFNDLTARDAQMAEMPGMMGPAKGKDFDKANAMGPYLVTRDELGDPYNLDMIVRVNGEEMSRGSSSTVNWTFEKMIEFVSQSETLHPGEIFGSGTVGDGCGFEHLRFLKDKDVVELEITGLGVLKTTIAAG